jgi:hypothetical protein
VGAVRRASARLAADLRAYRAALLAADARRPAVRALDRQARALTVLRRALTRYERGAHRAAAARTIARRLRTIDATARRL